ncbi:hypothetical protein [Bradyrhizobium sp.]|uniref:hypothetical protein n=1 Tax=Bradyrhizobium sp. TaxID=376 RepID=UPI000AB75D18|nr:hypothetical protein [Bradyrhizobium sp.]
MRRFGKNEREEIWDETVQWPIGDIEAAKKIRDICRAAADSAEKIRGLAGPPASGNDKYHAERYERAARAAMEIAMKISDDLMRDASVRQIVNLCMSANNLKTARILFRAIQAVEIREAALGEHPTLRE